MYAFAVREQCVLVSYGPDGALDDHEHALQPASPPASLRRFMFVWPAKHRSDCGRYWRTATLCSDLWEEVASIALGARSLPTFAAQPQSVYALLPRLG